MCSILFQNSNENTFLYKAIYSRVSTLKGKKKAVPHDTAVTVMFLREIHDS